MIYEKAIDMDARQFFNLVERMRAAQKSYFRTKSSDYMRQAMQYEKEIDAEIKRVNDIIDEQKSPKLEFE